MTWNKYHSTKTINSYIKCLSSKYRGKATLINIGRSTQGQQLKIVHVRSGTGSKPAIFIDGGIHAREWISPATVTYILRELVENSNSYSSLLSKFDFFILPLMNPDGYEFSRSRNNRLWRKNRSLNSKGGCGGVDLNRNFSYKWGGIGSSNNQCQEHYRGPRPFSEPESRAVRDFIMSRRRQIKMYLTFHSWGQMILYPWGYDRRVVAKDKRDLDRVGRVGARAMGRKYQVGPAATVNYEAAGASDDWAKGAAGIKYSYTIELPDTGKYKFILPSSRISRTGFEATRAVTAMANEVGKTIV